MYWSTETRHDTECIDWSTEPRHDTECTDWSTETCHGTECIDWSTQTDKLVATPASVSWLLVFNAQPTGTVTGDGKRGLYDPGMTGGTVERHLQTESERNKQSIGKQRPL